MAQDRGKGVEGLEAPPAGISLNLNLNRNVAILTSVALILLALACIGCIFTSCAGPVIGAILGL